MKQILTLGTGTYRIAVFIQDATSTIGAGLTGLTYNSSGLTYGWYANNGGPQQLSFVAGNLGTYTSGAFVEVKNTYLPGLYEFSIPSNLTTFAGRQWVVIEISGATNMVPVLLELQLIQANLQDGTSLGLSGMNSNVIEWLGTAVTSNAGVPLVDVAAGTVTTVTGNVNGTVAAVTTCTTVGTVTGTVTATVPGAGGTNVNVTQWNGTAVATPNIGGVPKVDVVDWLGTAVTSSAGIPITTNTGTVTATVPGAVTVSGTVTATVPSLVSANVTEWLGTAVTSNAGVPLVDVAAGTITTVTGNVNGTVAAVTTATAVGTVSNVLGTLPANVVQWLGTAVTSNAGVPLVDVNGITGTVTATVVGGTIATVTNPVSISTGQLTVKRNTLLNGFTFPMYNATTGNPATGLSVSCTRSIDGGALGSTANSPTEVGSGIYALNLAASDLNGGVITLVFVASAASATIITLITQT